MDALIIDSELHPRADDQTRQPCESKRNQEQAVARGADATVAEIK